jgi:hypothetical protein
MRRASVSSRGRSRWRRRPSRCRSPVEAGERGRRAPSKRPRTCLSRTKPRVRPGRARLRCELQRPIRCFTRLWSSTSSPRQRRQPRSLPLQRRNHHPLRRLLLRLLQQRPHLHLLRSTGRRCSGRVSSRRLRRRRPLLRRVPRFSRHPTGRQSSTRSSNANRLRHQQRRAILRLKPPDRLHTCPLSSKVPREKLVSPLSRVPLFGNGSFFLPFATWHPSNRPIRGS